LEDPSALLRDACLALAKADRTFDSRESTDMGLEAEAGAPCRRWTAVQSVRAP